MAGESEEIQIALLDNERELAGQARALEQLATDLSAGGVHQVDEVRNAPDQIALTSLPIEHLGKPVYGIDTRRFTPVTMPTTGLAVISGPAGSGQSTAILSCVSAVERWADAHGEPVDSVLLTFARDGLRSRERWGQVAYGEEEVAQLARKLTQALGGKVTAAAGGLFGNGTGLLGGPIGAPAPEVLNATVSADPQSCSLARVVAG